MTAPLVSVVMSVHNGAADVGRAVASILEQSLGDFELIAIDDGSTEDDTLAVLEALQRSTGDTRLRVVRIPDNIGLAAALNLGIALAQGRYIARQDHDDISHPTRLERQVRHMEANPRCGLLGTRAEIRVGDEPSGRFHDHPLDNATLQFDLLFNNPFVHSSVMIRKSALDAVGRYTQDPGRQPPEDYELWSRIARAWEVANLPERLVDYREMPESMSRQRRNPFLDRLVLFSSENLAHATQLPQPSRDCLDAAALMHSAYDKVDARADIAAIYAVVDAAAAAIEDANPGSDLGARTARAKASLRDHHRISKLPKWLRDPPARLRSLPWPSGLKDRVRTWLYRR